MKHRIAWAGLGMLLAVMAAAGTVWAVDEQIIAPFADELGAPITSVEDGVGLFITAVKWLYTILFIVATATVLLAGYGFATSGGDEKKLTKAKAQLKWAVVAIAVGLLATTVQVVVQDALGG